MPISDSCQVMTEHMVQLTIKADNGRCNALSVQWMLGQLDMHMHDNLGKLETRVPSVLTSISNLSRDVNGFAAEANVVGTYVRAACIGRLLAGNQMGLPNNEVKLLATQMEILPGSESDADMEGAPMQLVVQHLTEGVTIVGMVKDAWEELQRVLDEGVAEVWSLDAVHEVMRQKIIVMNMAAIAEQHFRHAFAWLQHLYVATARNASAVLLGRQ
jgi:hypothetical protein